MSEGEGKKGKVCHVGMGSSILIQRWVNLFAKMGWKVDLITFEPTDQGVLHPEVKQHVVNTGKIPIIRFIKAYLGVRKYLKKIKPDIIHVQAISSYGIYIGLHSFMGGKEPYILAAWGYNHIKTHKGIKRKLNKLCINRSKFITVSSPGLKDALVKELGADASKFRVFSWGIEQDVFKSGYEEERLEIRKNLNIDKKAPIIISARNLSPYYRVQNILQAVKKIKDSYPNSIFIFLRGYGSPEFENEMKEKAKELGIEKNVRFISKILRPREMALYLNLADIMVSLVKTDQLSAVLLESMACDAFPILSKIEVYKTYITHEKNGLFVDGDNIDEIANAIMYSLERPELMQNAYTINKEIIKKNEDWEVLSKEMIELYNISLALR